MKNIILAGVISIALFSCNEKEPEQDSTLIGTEQLKDADSLTADVNKIPVSTVTADTSMQANSTTTPTTTAPTITQGPGGTVQSTPATSAAIQSAAKPALAGMNPAHGQPNHRCDIAVGAPLNSPVAKPSASPVVNQVKPAATPTTITQTPTPAANTVTPAAAKPINDPAMKGKPNPAHGQPGHDCAVAVGTILN